MQNKRVLDSWFDQIVILLVLEGLFYLFLTSLQPKGVSSATIICSFSLNGILAALSLSQAFSRDKISIKVIFFFFNFVFFFLVPLAQYLTGRWMFLESSEDKNIFYANILTAFWMVVFTFGHRQAQKSVKASSNSLATGFCLVLSAYFVATAGINALLFRSGAGVVNSLGGWGPLGLIGQYYSRPLPIFLFLFSIYYVRLRNVYTNLLTGIVFIPAILLNFPTSTARFYAFAVYLGIFILFTRRIEAVNSFVYFSVMTLGIFGSDWLNFARFGDFSGAGAFKIDLDVFFEGHFDAYENFVHILGYVDKHGFDYGNQLLGVILFWLPRSAWADKPVGTGVFLAEYLNKTYEVHNKNISAPLIEEFYLAFGFLAVLAGGFLFGALAGWLDRKYQLHSTIKSVQQVEPAYLLLYPILVGLSLFILRGDALSAFAYSCGITASFATLRWLLIKKCSKRSEAEDLRIVHSSL
jgi:hypothetical protein